jgi:hypothetical protein
MDTMDFENDDLKETQSSASTLPSGYSTRNFTDASCQTDVFRNMRPSNFRSTTQTGLEDISNGPLEPGINQGSLEELQIPVPAYLRSVTSSTVQPDWGATDQADWIQVLLDREVTIVFDNLAFERPDERYSFGQYLWKFGKSADGIIRADYMRIDPYTVWEWLMPPPPPSQLDPQYLELKEKFNGRGVRSIALSAKSRLFAFVCCHIFSNVLEIHVLDLAAGKLTARIPVPSPDDTHIYDRTRECRDLSITLSPDGSMLALALPNGRILVWDLSAKRLVDEYFCNPMETSSTFDNSRRAVAISHDNRKMAALCTDQTKGLNVVRSIEVWELATSKSHSMSVDISTGLTSKDHLISYRKRGNPYSAVFLHIGCFLFMPDNNLLMGFGKPRISISAKGADRISIYAKQRLSPWDTKVEFDDNIRPVGYDDTFKVVVLSSACYEDHLGLSA